MGERGGRLHNGGSRLERIIRQIQRFMAAGYEGLGVPLGTDAFVQTFVKDK